jgi:hypothetical protein
MGTVCLNLILFKKTLSDKTVVRPEMSKMPQLAHSAEKRMSPVNNIIRY